MKALVVIAATGVIAAATHANVMHAGGYSSEAAPLAIALSALLAVGIAYATTAWRDGSKALSAILALCIVAGEAYWLFVNAERELASREATEAPRRADKAERDRAEQRLLVALAAKKAADDAAVSEAAKPGCARNCASLLKDAKDRAEQELAAARAALDALPVIVSPSPLAERIGVATWAWDLILATLRSVAVVGASVALALVLHSKRIEHCKAEMVDAPREVVTPVAITHRGSVALYLKETIAPAEGERVPIADLINGYGEWCAKAGVQPIEKGVLAREIARLFKKAGVETTLDGGRLYCLDARRIA
jgi:hypothetical protein